MCGRRVGSEHQTPQLRLSWNHVYGYGISPQLSSHAASQPASQPLEVASPFIQPLSFVNMNIYMLCGAFAHVTHAIPFSLSLLLRFVAIKIDFLLSACTHTHTHTHTGLLTSTFPGSYIAHTYGSRVGGQPPISQLASGGYDFTLHPACPLVPRKTCRVCGDCTHPPHIPHIPSSLSAPTNLPSCLLPSCLLPLNPTTSTRGSHIMYQ